MTSSRLTALASLAILLACGTARAQLAPQIITHPASQGVVPGSSVLFSVNASGTAPLAYQWRKNSIDIAGATAGSYTLNNVTTNDEANYTVRVSNASGAVTSQVATLTVYVAPGILTQPQGRTNAQGSNVTFSVLASGTAPLSYQWKKDSANIPGATLNGYSLNNIQPSDSGTYSVTVANPAGSVNSASAILQVLVRPTISAQPQNQTVLVGQTATFSVTAAGSDSLTYRWRWNGNNFLPFAQGPTTNSTLIITNNQPSYAGNYTCVVTNGAGGITSSVAVLTVNIPPTITAQPVSRTVGEGSNTSFGISATGPSLSYQWRKDGNPIPGATASSLPLSNVQFTNAGGYSCVVTNPFAAVTSAVATLTVGYPPVFTVHPVSQTNLAGGAVTFSGVVTGSPPLTLQWLKDGVPLPGRTNATLTLTNLQPQQIGWYHLTAASAFGSATSSNAALSLTGFDFSEFHGLVAYYPFSGNANDESGNGNNGIVNGASLSADRFGNLGSAYGFGGTNFIEIPDNAVFDAQSFTLSMWFNVDQFVGSGVFDQAMFLISKGQNNFELHLGSPGVSGPTGIRFLPRVGAGANWDTPPAAYTTNRWHHIATAYDPLTGGIAVFVDGQMLPLIGPSTLPATPDNSFNTWIGMRNFGTGPSFGTPARIDDVRIYNRALSALEVEELFTREAVGDGLAASAQWTPGGLAVRFPAAPNVAYSILYATNLPAVLWQKLADVPAAPTNRLAEILDPSLTNAAQRYYRIVAPPLIP